MSDVWRVGTKVNVAFTAAEHFRCNDLRRWKLEVGRWFSIRLHHWVKGDPESYQHAHPWNFLTFVITGGYDDVGAGRPIDCVKAPTLRYRASSWRHSVINVRPGTWTVVLTGRVIDSWRFWIGRRSVGTKEWNGRICDD